MDKQKIAYKIWQYRSSNGIGGDSQSDWNMAEEFMAYYYNPVCVRVYPDKLWDTIIELFCQHKWR